MARFKSTFMVPVVKCDCDNFMSSETQQFPQVVEFVNVWECFISVSVSLGCVEVS